MPYLKNTVTGVIIKSEIFGANYYSKDSEYRACTQSEIDSFELENKRKLYISSRQSYLASTDWYIAREYDKPGSYPDDVKSKRIKARAEINNIYEINTLEDLENININFS